MPFLPIDIKEFKEMFKTETPDFVVVTGDAYVDHPSFGAAIISRVLVKAGFSVGIIAQPDYKKAESFAVFGEPKFGFLVTSGNIDSMVNNYSVSKAKRKNDIYSPGNVYGSRPDRAVIVYSNKIREIYKKTNIILGGIEASLRRLAHYDYWSDKVRRSVILDSSADLLIYGMAEKPLLEVANLLKQGVAIADITEVNGTVYKAREVELPNCIELPGYNEITKDRNAYAKSFAIQYKNSGFGSSKALAERYNEGIVVQNPPTPPMTTKELDAVFAMPFMGTYHPIYEEQGGVPAINEVKFSLISSRGCFGGCSFCALNFHQGRVIQSRSHKSLIQEATALTFLPDFKGYIHDVGGPTANFYSTTCQKSTQHGACTDKRCLFPNPCKNLTVSHKDYLSLLKKLREIEGVKKVFIRSGLRYDYIIYDKDESFLNELCKHHVSGQLKVAPEHISNKVLEKMGKPPKEVYERFVKRYNHTNEKLNKKQYLVPYLMSSHPGSDLHAAIDLAEYLRDNHISPQQVQDFYPTPGTLSTAMYYTGLDPLTGESVYVPKSPKEKAMQRALIQYSLPQNERLVKEALKKADREDLIGFDKKCLIKPRIIKHKPVTSAKQSNTNSNSNNKKKAKPSTNKKARYKK